MNLLKKLYFESTLVGIIFLALFLFFLMLIAPKQGIKISEYLIPLFIIVVCLEIYFIRTQIIRDIRSINDNQKIIYNQTFIQLFSNGNEFDNYLEKRLENAKKIHIIHLGDYIPAQEEKDRRYLNIIGNFLKSNKECHRIISKTNNQEVIDWIKREIDDYKPDYKYFMYLNKKIITNKEIRTMGAIIIDNKELILGGIHKATFENPLFSIRNQSLVSFYSDYFEYLRYHSVAIEKDNIQDLER